MGSVNKQVLQHHRGVRLQFRSEFLHGTITNAYLARQIQFALKLLF